MLAILAALILSQADAGVDPYAQDRATRENLAAMRARYDAAAEADDQSQAALQKACGADYLALRVGMTWKRAKRCGGAFSLIGEGVSWKVYAFNGVTVRVSAGKITEVIAGR